MVKGNGDLALSQIRIILKVNIESLVLSKRLLHSGDIYYSSTKDIPAAAIEKIYIFDRHAGSDFPFREFSPKELVQILMY